jgi:hypothetical protein
MASLQSTGESYEYAKESAKDYVEALTTKAPKFMQILSGEKLLQDMLKSWEASPENFLSKFGSDLDKERPGLAKKVSDILSNKQYDQYTKMKLVQQITQSTEVGMKYMNEQLLELSNKGMALPVIASTMFGGDFIAAKNALQSAERAKEIYEGTNKALKMNSKDLLDQYKTLGMTVNESERLANLDERKNVLLNEQKKISIEELRIKNKGILATDEEKKSLEARKKAANSLSDTIDAQAGILKSYSEKQADVKTGATNEQLLKKKLEDDVREKEKAEAKVRELKSSLASIEATKDTKAIDEAKEKLKKAEDEVKVIGSKLSQSELKPDSPLNKVLSDLNKTFEKSSVLTGNIKDEIISWASSPAFLGIGAGIAGIAGMVGWFIKANKANKMLGELTSHTKLLERIAGNTSGGPGGGGGTGGTGSGTGPASKTKKGL